MVNRRLSGQFIYSVKEWMTDFPPRRTSVFLRTMLIEYLFQCRTQEMPVDLPEVLKSVRALFQVLDAAELEVERWHEQFEGELPKEMN
jgi:hypothetical protein